MSANGVKLISKLTLKSAQLAYMDKGFPKITKIPFPAIEPLSEEFEAKLFFDEFEEEKY